MYGLLPDSATFTLGRKLLRGPRRKNKVLVYDKRSSDLAGLIYGAVLLAVFFAVRFLVWDAPRWAWRKYRGA